MTTASTECPPSSSNSVLLVSERSAWLTATGRSEVILKSRSSAARKAFGRSCIASNDAAPRASQPQICLPRYRGTSLAASHASSSEGDSERMGGRKSVGTRLRYRRVEDFSIAVAAGAHRPVVNELAQVRSHGHLGGDHQLLVEVSVDAPGQLPRGANASPHLGQHLGFARETVRAIFLDLPHRILDRVPVPRKEKPRAKPRCW